MSFPEYRQQPEDHRSCIIMVQPIGSFVSKDSFSKIWAQLAKLEKVSIGKDGRSLYIRFVLNYPTENNEWGDFQHHRKVLGLICVARHNEKVSGSDLDKQYLDLKNLYDSTLLDSRLVILGLPRNAVRTKNDGMEFDESMATSCVTEGDLVIDPNHYDKEQPSKVIPDLLDRCNDGLKQIVSEMSDTTRRRILSYSDTEEACSYLNLDIEYMCQSLFYVLESKRLTATNVHVKQPSIITAPFETPSQLNMDLETKSVRNRFVARCRKRIGDLCLLVDLPNDAVVQYQAALELLNAAGDEFWVAGALEGLAVASSLVLSPYARHVTTDDNNMKRTSSFNGRTSPGLLLDPSITLHNSFNHLDLASSRPKVNVTFDDIIAKYREAISFYSKFAPAAIIEMEASLKATRLLIAHKVKKWMANTRARTYNTLPYNGGKHMLNSKIAMKKRLLHKYKLDPRHLPTNNLPSDVSQRRAVVNPSVPSPDASDKLEEEPIDVETVSSSQTPEMVEENPTTDDKVNDCNKDEKQQSPTLQKASLEQVIARCRLKSAEPPAEDNPAHKSVIESLRDVVNNVSSTDDVATDEPEPLSTDASPSTSQHGVKRYLSPQARTILSEWFRKHLYRPYPTFEEKRELAAQCGISTSKKTKMASEFLHHVAYVSLDDISYKERVERYDVMGDLYQQLKFDRKAAFFKRVAAMHCVSPLLPSPAWADCYSLLLKAFPGFKMSFDPADYQTEGQTTGWPGIRLRVFHELIYAARQIGNSAIIVRHISLCLHTMFNYMTCNEIQDLIQLLETCTKDNRDDGLPLSTTHGVKLPPVPFSSFPLLRRFDVLKLTPQLEPHKLKEVLPTSSVFIYSPLNLSRQVTRSLSIAEYEFGWVQDNPGSVEVAVHNPLPVELRLTDLSLLVEGVQFQSFPSSHSLPADSGPHTINIMGIPRSHGTLRITGYQMTLFGVVSRCLFSQLTHIRQKVFTVDVAPCLPSLHVSSQLPKSPYIATGGDNLVVTSAILQVYAGERRECHVTLKNNGPDAITKIDVVLQSDKFQDILREVLELDHSSLTASLPIQPEAEAKLTIKTVGSLRLSDLPDEMLMSPADRESKHRASSALIESVLKITYTGHEGDKQLYYRESLMAIDTVLIPSINVISQRITSLDVGRCDVGFEVFNESNMALEIKSGQESVSLKPMQSDWIHCRVDKSHCCSTLEECKETLTDVSLTWICASNRSGHVSTSSLHWSEPELDKLRQRPFTVVGSVAKNSCSRYMVGETVQVTYAITNISESDFSDVELKVRLHQDIASSQSDVQMGTSYVCMGPVSHHIPQFESGAIVELKPVLCIFYSGQYTLECVCLHNGVPITHIDSGLSLVVT